MGIDVSVIIPVYNTEAYLDEAVRSVLNQEGVSVEVIAVDDGSTDGSAEVLLSFGDRIKLIRQANSGQGAARNKALGTAVGEFVYFMDSDDWIDKNALAACVNLCRKDRLDFVFFDADSFGTEYDSEASPWFNYRRSTPYSKPAEGCSVIKDMLSRGTYRCSVCMCLYRREFLLKHGLKFPEDIVHEDEFFSAAAFLNAERVEGIAKSFYHRRLRPESVMTRAFTRRNAEAYMKNLELVRELATSPERELAVKELSDTFVTSLMNNSWNLPLKWRLRIAREVLKHPAVLSPKPFAALLFKKLFR